MSGFGSLGIEGGSLKRTEIPCGVTSDGLGYQASASSSSRTGRHTPIPALSLQINSALDIYRLSTITDPHI